MVPTAKHPGFNFIGRLLGPRGNTLKELQRDTGCKMLIRGKGSVKFRHGENEWDMAKLPQHAHLNEPLHVSPPPQLPRHPMSRWIACSPLGSLDLGRKQEAVDAARNTTAGACGL
jgi:hypothetical protein